MKTLECIVILLKRSTLSEGMSKDHRELSGLRTALEDLEIKLELIAKDIHGLRR